MVKGPWRPSGPVSHHKQESLLAALVSSCIPLWGTKKSITQGGVGGQSSLHICSVRHHSLSSTQRSPKWKGEGTTSFPTVYGASCTFKKAHPFGYEYVCMCVSSRVCTCVCTCVHPSRQRAQKDFLSCVGGY